MSEKSFQLFHWRTFLNLPRFFDLRPPEPARQVARIKLMERNIGLPVKAALFLVLFYHFFFSTWFHRVVRPAEGAETYFLHEIILEAIPPFFLAYFILNAGAATLLLGMHHFNLSSLQKVVFAICWVDALFLSALTLVTDGFDSYLYWVFLGLIVRNTVSVPSTARQVLLNLSVSAFYLAAGISDFFLEQWQDSIYDEEDRLALGLEPELGPLNEGFLLRLCLLLLVTICCYGVQVLMEKQRRAEEEAREHALRQEQLQATGRLAAEIAHQLKNPLGIINNAAFTLQRTVKEGKTITQQIKIIREEVDRSDRILTELMGYARLSEGQVEKLSITEELDRAIDQVFPAGAKYETLVRRHYSPALPAILAQRGHLSEVFVNILQNAREAMGGRGEINLHAGYGDGYAVVVSISDNGPGIPADKLPNIFEPYFTTKEKGTGLGLAIVKHNTELYNGTVEVQSEVGVGTTFTVMLPAKTVFNLKR